MNHLTAELIQKVNDKLKDKPLFYVSKDLERGIGLANVVENYFNLSAQPSILHNYLKIDLQALFDFSEIAPSTYGLLKSDFVKKIINKCGKKLFFRFFQQSIKKKIS